MHMICIFKMQRFKFQRREVLLYSEGKVFAFSLSVRKENKQQSQPTCFAVSWTQGTGK